MRQFLRVLPWVWIGAFVTLVAAGFFLYKSGFTLDHELNLVDITTALFTIFLALYIPSRLERRLSNQRFELVVLTRCAERVQADFTTIRATVSTAASTPSTDQLNAIVQAFTNISHGIHTLDELSSLCKRPDITARLQELQKRRLAFKRLVTGGDFQRSSDFGYSLDQIALITQQYYETDMYLSKLIIYINRA